MNGGRWQGEPFRVPAEPGWHIGKLDLVGKRLARPFRPFVWRPLAEWQFSAPPSSVETFHEHTPALRIDNAEPVVTAEERRDGFVLVTEADPEGWCHLATAPGWAGAGRWWCDHTLAAMCSALVKRGNGRGVGLADKLGRLAAASAFPVSGVQL